MPVYNTLRDSVGGNHCLPHMNTNASLQHTQRLSGGKPLPSTYEHKCQSTAHSETQWGKSLPSTYEHKCQSTTHSETQWGKITAFHTGFGQNCLECPGPQKGWNQSHRGQKDIRGYEVESERAVSRQFAAAEVGKVTGISEEIVCRKDVTERQGRQNG